MGEASKIQWTDNTFNPWIGCTKVGPPCDHCYAEALNKRTGHDNWGSGKPRRKTSDKYWNEPLRWNREAEKSGKPIKVFCGSMCDWADNEVLREWQRQLLDLIEETPHLRWQLLSKRGPNIPKIVPSGWFRRNQHVGVMLTTGDQEEVDRDAPRLLKMKAEMGIHWIGLSCEPLLGRIILPPGLDWIIVGGESGGGARPFDVDAARVIVDQCQRAGVAVFVKQFGARPSLGLRLHDKKGGDWSEWPADLRVREFPAALLE